MESCLYEGVVYHERLKPVKHRFHHRLFMNFINLAEVSALLRAGLLSEGRFSSNSFLRRDHFGDPTRPMSETVRELVLRETGVEAKGPICLLTQLRNFGYYFSPLNLFFCYAPSGNRVQAVVAEVQNTPWLERHCYVLWQGNQVEAEPTAVYRHSKSLHVSPFMDMDLNYQWQLSSPADLLQVEIVSTQENNPLFRASMSLRRISLSFQSLRHMRWRYPLEGVRITAAIYLQAFHLWRKKCPFYPHPRHRAGHSSPLTKCARNVQDCSRGSGAAV